MKILTFLILGVLFIGLVSAGQMTIYVAPGKASNVINPNIVYNYTFHFDTIATCASPIWSNYSNIITTDLTGVANITLTFPTDISEIPTHICVDRNGTRDWNLSFNDQIFNRVYLQSANASGNIYVGGNVSSDHGFFNFIGKSASRITKGWFTDLDVANNINSSNLTAFNILVNGTNIDTTYLNTNDFNTTNTSYREKYNSTWVNNLNVTGNLTIDVSKLFVDSSGGNVGINTSTPAVKFQVVNGLADWTGDFKNYAANAYGLRVDLSGSSGANYALGVYTATGTGLFVENNGEVGIGTTSPGTELHVKSASGYAELRLEAGDATSGGTIEFYNSDGLKADIYADDNSALHFRPGGSTDAITALSSGNVGIGTANPGAPLEIQTNSGANSLFIRGRDNGATDEGTITFLDNGGITQAYMQTSADDLAIVPTDKLSIGTTAAGNAKLNVRGSGTTSATYSFEAMNSNGNTRFIVRDDGLSAFYGSSNAEIVRINASGFVGINTTSPGARLEINGGDQVGNILLRLHQNGRQYWDFLTTSNEGLEIRPQKSDYSEFPFFWISDSNGNLKFGVNTSSGFVGIGTSTPTQRLDINYASTNTLKGIAVNDTSASDVGLTVNNANTSSTSGILFNIGNSNKARIRADNNGDLNLQGASFTNDLTIDSTGNVGIGTTAPATTLEVNKTISFSKTASTCDLTINGSICSNTTGTFIVG